MALSTPPGGAPVVAHPQDFKSENRPELDFLPGELAPAWASPYPYADLSDDEQKALYGLADVIGERDIAARRWEVEQSWEAQLFARGYMYLLPRKGGGWILPPFATNYHSQSNENSNMKWYGYETNIYASYGEIIISSLTRDLPQVRFEPHDPNVDSDIIAANAATKYAKVLERSNDLLTMHQQLAWYLANDGRAIIVTDFIQDAQRYGYEEPADKEPLVPEVQDQTPAPFIYMIRHASTSLNDEDKLRGDSDVPINIRGEREINLAAAFLKDKGIQIIICSPVPRALESAQIIAKALGGIPVQVDEHFGALNIGSLAGTSNKDAVKEHFKTGEPFPDGESPQDFKERVRDGVMALLQSPVKPSLVVTHDSVISETMKQLNGENAPCGEVAPGSVVGLIPAAEGTLDAHQVYPFQRPPITTPQKRQAPRGEVVVSVYGKLQAKVPINAGCLEDFPFVMVSREYDIAYVRAMFPKQASRIHPGGSANSGENQLDRIARINVALGLEASYVTGDSMVRDCTVSRIWLRPSFFMEIADEDIRRSLLAKFPDGCHMVIAGAAFVGARNESMDDHCTLVQAYPGAGQNRMALLSKLISLQKRLNNWIDLLNDYFIRTVPARYINSDVFDVEAIKHQPSRPGPFIPFTLRDNPNIVNQQQMIVVEPTPTHQPSFPQFIQLFFEQYPQLLSGALPTLFGAESNNEATATAVGIQRDMALGRLGITWHEIQKATCSYFRQAIRLASQCVTRDIVTLDSEGARIRIDLADMKGNIQAFPQQSSNFPETWNQKQLRYQKLMAEAGSNPMIASLISSPSNAKLTYLAAGFTDFKNPEADSYEKQMGEIEALISSEPLPNPAKAQALQMVEQATSQMEEAQAAGHIFPPEEIEQIQQETQHVQAMPDDISSVRIDIAVDNHAVEAQACKDYLNSFAGRQLHNGTRAERGAYQNVRLHMLEHQAQIKPPSGLPKPASLSINFKDLPPEAAAQVLQDENIGTTPQSVAQNRVVSEKLKTLSKVNPKGE